MGPGFKSLKVHQRQVAAAKDRVNILQRLRYIFAKWSEVKVTDQKVSDKSVFLTQRVHPFPFRTRKLSFAVPKILGWRRPGKIGQR